MSRIKDQDNKNCSVPNHAVIAKREEVRSATLRFPKLLRETATARNNRSPHYTPFGL